MATRNYTDELRHRGGAPDEYTGDPRIREQWEATRDQRHLIIRRMFGDPWAEQSWPRRVNTVISTSFLWLIALPFVWAALAAITLFVVSFTLVPHDQNISNVMGQGFDGGLGDKIMIWTGGVAVLLATFGAYGRTFGRDAEIYRLRGLSNTDLLDYYEKWLRQKAAEAAERQRDIERWERRDDARYQAEEIGKEMTRVLKQSGLYKGSIYQ